MMIKKVLVITYYWPPAGGPGVQRWLKFCKYLPEYGWSPVILTVENGSYPATDETLLEDIPQGIEVYKTKAGGPFWWYNVLRGRQSKDASVALINTKGKRSMFDRFAIWVRSNFFIPDARKGWKKHALRVIPRVMSHHNIDLVVSTGPPHSTHLIGQKVAQRYGLPWVADFRDPWTTVYYNQMMPRSKFTRWLDLRLENRVLSSANVVLTVGMTMKQEFESRANRVEVLWNGFDEDDIFAHTVHPGSDSFEILHTGNLASNQNPGAFWRALENLVQQDSQFARDLRVSFVGNTDHEITDSLVFSSVKDHVRIAGYVSHHAATRMMSEAALLLLVIPDTIGNQAIITGKLFEYLASGTPILPFGPKDGDASWMLSECGRETMIDFEDQKEAERWIRLAYDRWVQNGRITVNMDTKRVGKYSRRNSARILSTLLREITERS